MCSLLTAFNNIRNVHLDDKGLQLMFGCLLSRQLHVSKTPNLSTGIVTEIKAERKPMEKNNKYRLTDMPACIFVVFLIKGFNNIRL